MVPVHGRGRGLPPAACELCGAIGQAAHEAWGFAYRYSVAHSGLARLPRDYGLGQLEVWRELGVAAAQGVWGGLEGGIVGGELGGLWRHDWGVWGARGCDGRCADGRGGEGEGRGDWREGGLDMAWADRWACVDGHVGDGCRAPWGGGRGEG